MGTKCPYCGHGISLRDPKPGKYKPKCPKCQEQFLLVVPTDPGEPLRAGRIASPAPQDVAATSLPTPSAGKPKTTATVPGNTDVTLPPSTNAMVATVAATSPPRAAKKPSTAIDATQVHQPVDPAATAAPVPPSAETAVNRGNDFTEFLSAPDVGAAAASVPLPAGTPSLLNGYRVVRELGRGAMGAVYLAKQVSLDREVAVKTIQSQWASNPAFIARFTREAYAAAQMSHHNVVQIYDLGQDKETHFFSMEFVRGKSLDDVIKERGKLDVEAAVGIILQVARGLQYAHNLGMVHRDVKPGNILLNDQGIVKVTDLGLVKTPQMAAELDAADEGNAAQKASTLMQASAAMTMSNMAMGTPAYMAPEQAENAAGVDHRADIYSLGCTLYVALTGRPPFEGASAMEVITKHKSEPVIRPEAIVKRIPPVLSEITLKMVAKKPEDRFANMGEVITALENYLGILSSGPYSPKEEQAALLEKAVAEFNRPALIRVRNLLPTIFFAGVLLLALLLIPFSLSSAVAVASLAVTTPLMYGVLASLSGAGPVLLRLRRLLFELRIMDWLTYGCAGFMLLGVLFLLGWFWACLAASVIAAGLAFGYHFVCDRQLMAQRKPAFDRLEPLLKSLRLQGVEEASLHQFVAKYSGEQWEEFFEHLFGYENKLKARELWGKNPQGNLRPKFRGWRERIVNWADEKLRQFQEARDRQHLQNVEERSLEAKGMDLVSARKQAQRVADAMLDQAAEMRLQPAAPANFDPTALAAKKRERTKAMLAAARAGKSGNSRRRLAAAAFSPLTFVLGPQVRFLVGCLLVVGCALWASENKLLTVDHAEQLKTAVQSGNVGGLENVAKGSGFKPLSLPVVGPFFTSIVPGVAGLLLIFLGLFSGWRMSLFALPAAAIMVLGPQFGTFGLSGLGISPDWIFLVVGLGIGVAGFLFGQTFEDGVREG